MSVQPAVVDSSGWIEVFTDVPRAGLFLEAQAIQAVAAMQRAQVVNLDSSLAIAAYRPRWLCTRIMRLCPCPAFFARFLHPASLSDTIRRSALGVLSTRELPARRTINSQLAPQLQAVNVSGQTSGRGVPFSQSDTKPDRYVCCLPSLGDPSKRNGGLDVWGDF